MKYLNYILIALLTFLALASAIAKIGLAPMDVEFYGGYGFSNITIVAFGVIQLAGGGLLVIPKTRILGASIISATFLVSLILLLIDGNIPVAAITLIAIAALAYVIHQTRGLH